MGRDSTQKAAFRRFADAVDDFAAERGLVNREGYLAANRALEESHGRPTVKRTRRAPALR